jgi:hypothetical protein
MELAIQSFCHAHCWNLPLCCSEPYTWSPCYWTPGLLGGNCPPFPSFITACWNSKIELWSELGLTCLRSFFRPFSSSLSAWAAISVELFLSSCWSTLLVGPQQFGARMGTWRMAKGRWEDAVHVELHGKGKWSSYRAPEQWTGTYASASLKFHFCKVLLRVQ